MPGPRVTPVHSDERVPESVDVVVIGGGIIGTSTALELAERGHRVALCEKGGIGQEQSSRNWGWVRISERDPREIPLMALSHQRWESLPTRISGATGFQRCGIAFACNTDEEYANSEASCEQLAPYEVGARMISASELNTLFPQSTGFTTKGALYTPHDGRAEPQLAAPAIAEGARQHGASVLTECAVRGIERSGGKVSGVVAERGRIGCSSVVVAGGAWSSLFLGSLGIRLPQLKVINSVLRTTPFEGPQDTFWRGDYAIRKRLDGGYTVAGGHANIADIVPDSFRFLKDFWPLLKAQYGMVKLRLGWRFLDEWRLPRQWAMDESSPFEYCRVLDPKPSRAMLDEAWQALTSEFPGFREAAIAQRWAGCIDVSPDTIPVISRVDSDPGVVVATGFSGHGFGIGPGAGCLAADLVTNDQPSVDPDAFRLSRFSDGSSIEVGSM